MECTDLRKPWDANPQSMSPGSHLPRTEHLDMAMSTQGDTHTWMRAWSTRVFVIHFWNSTCFRFRLFNSQRMLLTFTWCQILIFWNLYICTWVSKIAIFSTTLSNRAVVKLLSFITACHMLPYPPQLEKSSFYLTSPTAFRGKHLFGLSAHELSKL